MVKYRTEVIPFAAGEDEALKDDRPGRNQAEKILNAFALEGWRPIGPGWVIPVGLEVPGQPRNLGVFLIFSKEDGTVPSLPRGLRRTEPPEPIEPIDARQGGG